MLDTTSRNALYYPSITPTSTEYTLLYAPGTKDFVALDGFVSDFRLFAQIRSVAELVYANPQPTEDKSYFSEQEIEQYQYGLLGGTNYKNLEIFTSESFTSEKKYLFSIPLFNRKPHKEVDIKSIFTSEQYLKIPKYNCIWGRCTGLSGADKLSFWISAYEEGSKDIAQLQEVFQIVGLQANTVASFVFPEGTQGYAFRCRNADNEPATGIYWGWRPTDFTDNTFDFLPAYSEQSSWFFGGQTTNPTLYLKANTNCVVIVKVWKI